jgi:hypothetical protein
LGWFFYFGLPNPKGFKKRMLKAYKEESKVLIGKIGVLFWYMLFPSRRYLLRQNGSHSLIQEQSFYGKSSLLSKSFRLISEYRYLQFLLPQFTSHQYFSHIFIMKSNEKEVEPLNANRPRAKKGEITSPENEAK